MFTNPVCHWSGGVNPLLDLDFRIPVEQPFPSSSAEETALGNPAPTAMWDCQDASGALDDKIGSVDLTPVNAPFQNQRASGIWHSDDYVGGVKKAVEFTNGATQTFAAASSASLDMDASTSFALRVVFRCKRQLMTATRIICGKWLAGVGYQLRITNVGVLTLRITDTVATVNNIFLSDTGFVDGDWHCVLAVVDRNAGFINLYTDLGSPAPLAITAASLTNAEEFSFGFEGTSQRAFAGQISHAAMWVGASAEGQNAANLTNFFVHGTDPTGLLTTQTHASRISDLIGEVPGYGTMFGDFSYNHLPIGYNGGLTDELGVRCNLATTTLLSESDRFQLTWTTSPTLTVVLTYDDSPRGMREALRLSITGGAGYIQHQVVTAASTVYSFYVFVKRHSAQATDVNCNLEMYDLTGGASVATQAFTATAEWQLINLTATTNVGQVSTGFRINCTDASAALAVSRATAVAGNQSVPIYTTAAPSVSALTDWRAASAAGGDWLKGAQGEQEITYICDIDNETFRRQLIGHRSSLGGNQDGRNMRLESSEAVRNTTNDNTGAYVDDIDTPSLTQSNEHVVRFRWDINNLLPGGTNHEVIYDGVTLAGPAGVWGAGNTVQTFYVGLDNTGARQLNGLIARIRTWEFPQ